MTIRPSPEPRSYTTSSLLTFASSSIRSTTATGVGTNGASGAFSCADARDATAVASTAIRTARIPFARSTLELDRIDIEVPAYLAGAQAVKRLCPLAEKPLQCAPRTRLREHLRPLAARDPREAHRHRVEQRDVVLRAGCDAERLLEKRKRVAHLLALGAEHRLVDERREPGRAALGELRFRERCERVARERLVKRMLRIARLHEHLARCLRPPSAPGDLVKLREEPLGAAVVDRHQRGVRIDDPHQGDPREVVSFREDLSTEQNFGVAGDDRAAHRVPAALRARRVAIDPQEPSSWEAHRERLLEALRAASERRERDVAAGRAMARNRRFVPAVMTPQPLVGGMEDEVRGTARAAPGPSARAADEHRRVAAAV